MPSSVILAVAGELTNELQARETVAIVERHLLTVVDELAQVKARLAPQEGARRRVSCAMSCVLYRCAPPSPSSSPYTPTPSSGLFAVDNSVASTCRQCCAVNTSRSGSVLMITTLMLCCPSLPLAVRAVFQAMLVEIVEAAKGALGPATVEVLDAEAELHELTSSRENLKEQQRIFTNQLSQRKLQRKESASTMAPSGSAVQQKPRIVKGYLAKADHAVATAIGRLEKAKQALQACKDEYRRLQYEVATQTTEQVRSDKAKYDAVVALLDAATRSAVSLKAALLVNKGRVQEGAVYDTLLDSGRMVTAKVQSYDPATDLCEVMAHKQTLDSLCFSHGFTERHLLTRARLYTPTKGPRALHQKLSAAASRGCAGDADADADEPSDVVNTMMAVIDDARATKPLFDAAVGDMLRQGETSRKWRGRTGPGYSIKPGPLKKSWRASVKMYEKYNSNPLKLLDMCRSTVVCDGLEDVEFVLQCLGKSHDLQVLRVKDRLAAFYDSIASGGYRDLLLNCRHRTTNHICELQISLKALQDIKDGGSHAVYRLVRITDGLALPAASSVGGFSEDDARKLGCGSLRYLQVNVPYFPPKQPTNIALACLVDPLCLSWLQLPVSLTLAASYEDVWGGGCCVWISLRVDIVAYVPLCSDRAFLSPLCARFLRLPALCPDPRARHQRPTLLFDPACQALPLGVAAAPRM